MSLKTRGRLHSIYWNPRTGRREPVPRHSEIPTCWREKSAAPWRYRRPKSEASDGPAATRNGAGYKFACPEWHYGYDSHYNRVTSAGGVSMTYIGVGSLGALKPYVVTNTLTGGSAAITYTYDEWGRVVGRNIDSADNETCVFDALGRVTSIVNALCPTSTSFGYSYFDPTHPTNRIGTISYPNGQNTDFNYFGITGDERLEEIKNLTPSSAVLSQNDYTYSADGKIATWQQQIDSNTPVLWTEGYDAANQLTSAVLTNTQISSPAIRSDSYGYDAVGNATTFNVSGVSRSPSYNALNQLTGSTPTGSRSVGFTGLLNGAATGTVNGSSATVNGSNYFSGTTSLTTASTNNLYTVPVVATDTHSNVRTNHYQTVVPAELTYSPTYDNDGNELTNGAGQTYTWDAKNELMSIVYTAGANSGNHTEFSYDALGRRISIVERTGTTIGSGTVTSTKQLVWNGSMIAEERNVSNAVTKKFFAQGEQIGSSSYYYTFDHLGSVREMTDSSGSIQARYDYDPYGRATPVGTITTASDFQYAGYYEHATSGLNLTWFRAYDPNTAKWLSRDPYKDKNGNHAEIALGPNLYAYAFNKPILSEDTLGLCPCTPEEFQKEGADRAQEVASYTRIFGSILSIPPEIAKELDSKYPCTASGAPTAVATVIEHVGRSFIPFVPEAPQIVEGIQKIIDIILN